MEESVLKISLLQDPSATEIGFAAEEPTRADGGAGPEWIGVAWGYAPMGSATDVLKEHCLSNGLLACHVGRAAYVNGTEAYGVWGIGGTVRKDDARADDRIEAYEIGAPVGKLLMCVANNADASSGGDILRAAYAAADDFYGHGRWKCVRQWWNLQEIERTYSEFAKNRQVFYEEWFDGSAVERPASTCVGVTTAGNAQLLFCPIHDDLTCEVGITPPPVPHPRDYGFNYERVFTLRGGNHRLLFVSATGGFISDGKVPSALPQDQLSLSISNVERITTANGFSLEAQGVIVAYVQPELISSLRDELIAWTGAANGNQLRVVTPATICRADMGLEIDAFFAQP